MNMLDTFAVLLALAAAFSYLNHRFIRLPSTVGLLVAGLLASAGVLALDSLFPSLMLIEHLQETLAEIDFTEFLMHGILGLLLFAGALHVNLEDLLATRGPVLTLASAGVAISTAIVGTGAYLVFSLFDVPVPLPYCFVFGALISPTDPVAVLGIMKSLKAPKRLETKISGESLLNDGVGIVLFVMLLAAAGGGHGGHVGITEVLKVFLVEVVGGVALGLGIGYGVYRAMKTVNEPNLEILMSVALVMSITFLAFQLHASAPLACVMAGLLIGNHGRFFAMSSTTREAVDHVWAFADYALNAVLFLLLGLEVLAIPFKGASAATAALLIPLVLIARFLCVSVPITVMKLKRDFMPGTIPILTWGGLRGGISVALALSLPDFEGREAVLTATYGIVIFSILVQGMTIGPVLKKFNLQSLAGTGHES